MTIANIKLEYPLSTHQGILNFFQLKMETMIDTRYRSLNRQDMSSMDKRTQIPSC